MRRKRKVYYQVSNFDGYWYSLKNKTWSKEIGGTGSHCSAASRLTFKAAKKCFNNMVRIIGNSSNSYILQYSWYKGDRRCEEFYR